jgi:hypothetical protein
LNRNEREFFGFELTLLQTVFIPFNLVLNYGSEANRSPSPCLLQMEAVEAIRLGFSKQTTTKKFLFEPKQTETRSVSVVFGLFCETKSKKIQFVSVF